MKKGFVTIIAAILILCCVSCTGQKQNKPTVTGSSITHSDAVKPNTESELINTESENVHNTFKLDATLDTESHKLSITQKLNYKNNTGKGLQEMCFNIIPKAFESAGGGVDVKKIAVAHTECSLKQVKGTVYKIALPAELPANEQLDIQMEYVITVPNIVNRFGYQDSTYNLGNFIITPAVYGPEGWTVEPYVDLGDAFYTDIADYEVKINVPNGYTIAATGDELEPGLFCAKSVRDFAFCTSDVYNVLKEEYNGLPVEIYYSGDMDTTAQHAMDTVKKSLELCNKTFGEYPYEKLSVVMNGLTGGVSGMEYPMLIMVDPDITLEEYASEFDLSSDKVNAYMLPFDSSICHEIAHQWFYGIVGNDQIAQPWLDEGMCRFTEYLFQEAYFTQSPEDGSVSLVKDRIMNIYSSKAAEREKMGDDGYAPEGTAFKESLYYWVEGDTTGYDKVYDESASLLYAMQQQMGSETFEAALKDYVKHFAYGFVTKDSFIEFWNSKSDFNSIFSLYFD